MAGSTASNNFPAIAGAHQANLAGVAGNAFVAKVDPANKPAISLVPAKVAFGNQALSVRSAAKTVSVVNAGTAPLSVSTITPPSTDFAETDDCVGTVSAGGGTCTINITFTPAALGAVTDEFSVADNAADSPHTITVTGTGVAASTAVTVSPTSLSFANQSVGSVSAPQTVTITNTGTSTLNITQISASGDFVQTNTCGATLNVLSVGQSCTASVSFQPTASGARAGTLSISDNGSGSPQTVTLSGTGLAVFSLSSTSSTTTVPIGTTSATFTVSASTAGSFTGKITLSCSSGATCSFSPATIFAGQKSTLTISSLSAATPNPYNFTVNGISGSQTASVTLTVLLADFSLSASPALDTIISGQPAAYTVVVTPSNGFDKQLQLTCANAPVGASCEFAQASVTPNGKPVSVKLTLTTTKTSSLPGAPKAPFGGVPPAFALWLGCLVGLAIVTQAWKQRGRGAPAGLRPLAFSWRAVALSMVMIFLAGCRSTTLNTVGTPTGNYTITITGTLGSNSSVQRSTTVNLSVT